MIPEQQRIAIAEACGCGNRWTIMKRGLYYRPKSNGYTMDVRDAWIVTEDEADKHVYPHDEPVTKRRAPLLDYLNDLNAMHEAEKVLNEKQVVWYMQKLTQTRFRAGDRGTIGCMIDRIVFATAAQRAEAFLKTIGKWEESA